MQKIETIPVVINEGEVYFDDPFELRDNQWYQEGNCRTAEIPAIEPTKEQLSNMDARDVAQMYLKYRSDNQTEAPSDGVQACHYPETGHSRTNC